MLVTTLHIPGREQIHEICHSRFLGILSSAIFDRFHTLDDIRGLCIAAFWEPDLSWKLSGICIRMATELNLHHAFYECFYTPDIGEDTRRESLEKTRLWYLLYVLDHQGSIAYGRPPVMAELRPIKDFEVMLNSPWCTPADQALIAQVTGLVILSKAFQDFGLEPKRIMEGDDASVLNHFRFTENVRLWKQRWDYLRETNVLLGGGLELHYDFSELVLHSLVLRGRSLDTLHDLPTSLRPLTLRGIEAAHRILRYFMEEYEYRDGMVGVPFYMHSMIAFAVVFLMKMSRRWHVIGITIDPNQRTRPLIHQMIKLLRNCKAGADHMVFSMANGFERMLKQKIPRANQKQRPESSKVPSSGSPWSESRANDASGQSMNAVNYLMDQQSPLDSDPNTGGNVVYPMQQSTEVSPYNWGLQDSELWSLGLGYDLLAPGGDAEFPFFLHGNNHQAF